MALSTAARFWPKVDRDGPVPEHRPDLGPCWLWLAGKTNGYGRFNQVKPKRTSLLAYRVAYELTVGPIPDGMELDHLCRVRACVNPAHLEVTDHRTNTLRGDAPTAVNARKTHCVNGHEFTPENTGPQSNGGRRCRTCDRARPARRRQRKTVPEVKSGTARFHQPSGVSLGSDPTS